MAFTRVRVRGKGCRHALSGLNVGTVGPSIAPGEDGLDSAHKSFTWPFGQHRLELTELLLVQFTLILGETTEYL